MRIEGATRAVKPAGWIASVGVVLAVITPKCPLCVAGVLAWIGLGGVLAESVAPWVQMVGVVMAAGALSVVVVMVLRNALAVSAERKRLTELDGAPPGGCVHCSEQG